MSTDTIANLLQNIQKVIIGKEAVVKQVIAALLARGHILIEDVPGVGKTLLAKSLALSLDGIYKRVQFTPDLLPSDITGVSVFNQKNLTFEFREGPVFTNILLADELNRATPRTQSSLLESMEERQVTVDGKTYVLPTVFFAMATQNPIEQQGVYRLPEAQLDRFLMQIDIGYPGHYHEIQILEDQRLAHPIDSLSPVATIRDILDLQERVKHIYVDKSINDYIVRLVEATRAHADLLLGASPRASLALYRVSQAYSLIDGNDFVTPDTVKALCHPILRHRLLLKPQSQLGGVAPDRIIDEILRAVDVPIKNYEL